MPFDGSGTYTPPSAPTFPAIAGTTITASYYNATINDIATALSNCLTRDNQGKPSVAMDWNNKNLTNVASLSATSITSSSSVTCATLAASGNTTVGGTLGVTDAVTASAALSVGTTLTVTGAASLNSTLAVTSNATVGGTLGVTGTTTLGTANITTGAIGTLTLTNDLAVTEGGTGASTAAAARTNLGAAASGAITASGLTMATARLLGRTTASTGAVEEITVGSGLSLSGGSLTATGGGTTTNPLTMNNGGAGAASGTTFDGSAARTISYNTIGASPDTPREQAVTSSATVTPTFSNDIVIITAQATGLTLANPTGTPIPNFAMVIRIKDNGSARSITYGTNYRAVGVSLPTTTVISKTLYLGMIYNATDTKWDVVSVAQEA